MMIPACLLRNEASAVKAFGPYRLRLCYSKFVDEVDDYFLDENGDEYATYRLVPQDETWIVGEFESFAAADSYWCEHCYALLAEGNRRFPGFELIAVRISFPGRG